MKILTKKKKTNIGYNINAIYYIKLFKVYQLVKICAIELTEKKKKYQSVIN